MTDTEQSVKKKEAQEAAREEIRQRVRNATAQNEYFRPAKPTPSIRDDSKKTVAAYTRVSTLQTQQVSSIENQTKFYTKKIAENENWEMDEIYSDEGKSGTSLRHRDAFHRMMANASEHKMDLILCASVSRFARNMSDCLDQVAKLKTLHPSRPIGVFFETENIYTLDPDSDQSLAIHAMLADWESANKSRRMILSYDQRILTGQYPVADLLGYRHTKNGELIIEPEEAKTVRFIFLACLNGSSYGEIAKLLTLKRRPTLRGRTDWNAGMVRNVMTNERTWGDLEARKTIVVDYKRGVVVKNNGQRDSAYVPAHHEGIVSKAVATAARMRAFGGRNVPGGFPAFTVLHEGRLKGFVNVPPSFPGIDRETLCFFSESAGTPPASFATKRTQCISDGYECFPDCFCNAPDIPKLTLSRTALHFNHACHAWLSAFSDWNLLCHPKLCCLILRGCTKDMPNALVRVRASGRPMKCLPAGNFVRALFELFGANPKERLMLRGLRRTAGAVPYLIFCPDAYGANTFSSLSEQELLQPGVQTVNPLIGALPSREEVEEELEQLLLSM